MARRLDAKTLLGILISVVCTVLFLWSVDWGALGEALGSVLVLPVLAACGLLLGEFVLRALRWKVLLRPLAPEARIRDLFVATVIGAAANTLLPLRAGEIAKPLVAAKKTGVGIPQVVATAVMERVYDIFGLICVLMTMVLVLPDDPGRSATDAVLVDNLKTYGGIFGAVAFSAMLVFFFLASRGAAAGAIFRKITSLAPAPVARKFDSLFDGFVEGLANARDPHGLWQAALLSMAIWFNGALAIYVLFKAFELALPLGAACFTAVAIALTVAVPQAPGFFGVFHVAIEKTMLLWSVDGTPAKAFAIVFWAVSFMPVTATGLLAMWTEGLSLGGLWKGNESHSADGDTP